MSRRRRLGLGVDGAAGLVDEKVRDGSAGGFAEAPWGNDIAKIARPMIRNDQARDVQASVLSVVEIGQGRFSRRRVHERLEGLLNLTRRNIMRVIIHVKIERCSGRSGVGSA